MPDDPTRETRLSALRELVESAGGPAAFARLHDGVDPTYVSQLLNRHRNFGERAARNMEKKLGLPHGHLDQESSRNLPPADQQFLATVTEGIATHELPDHVRQAILTLISSSPEKH